MDIECVDNLQHTPGASPRSSPILTHQSRKAVPVEEGGGNYFAGNLSAWNGVWCPKCKAHHTTLFSCPKAMNGFGHQKASEVARLDAMSLPPVVEQMSSFPPLPPSAVSAKGADSVATAHQAGFERLSALLGSSKFSTVFLPKLVDFENEEALLLYGAKLIADNDMQGLRQMLVADCALSGIHAQTLAGALYTMSF